MKRYLGLLAGLLLLVNGSVSADDQTDEPKFSVERFEISGDSPVTADRMQEVLSSYTGRQISLTELREATKKLEAEIKEESYPFYRVTVPPQKLDNKVTKLKILRFNLDKIEVTGNEHFTNENIRRNFPHLVQGESPNTRETQRSLQVLNQHPSKRATVVIRQSQTTKDVIDAEIQVRDVKPQQYFASLSNTGTEETGHLRLSVGYQHSNLFDRDHTLTLSYTTSPGYWSDVEQAGMFYRVPFYDWGGSLRAYYTYSSVDSGAIDSFNVSGSGRFYGIQYKHELTKINDYSQSAFISLDDKHFNSDITLIGIPLGTDVRSRPLTIGYIGRWKKLNSEFNFSVALSANTGGGADNDDLAYNSVRFAADRDWTKLNIHASAEHLFANHWKIAASFHAQETSDPLISGEQIGLGGVNTIRGMDEREIAGDQGHSFRLEAWAPAFDNNIRPFMFIDTGHISLVEPIPGLSDNEGVSSAGVGLTWSYKENLSASLIWGHVLDGAVTTEKHDDKFHISMIYRFD